MITKIFTLCIVLFGLHSTAWGHPGETNTDWRLDRQAFESARDDKKVYPPSGFRGPIVIDQTEMKFKLEELTGARNVVIDGATVRIKERGSAANLELARKWLAQEYKALGFNVSTHSFPSGANFIAERPGTSGKILILSSHMDSVGNAGADDDGVGTIAALQIAQALKDTPLKHTLRVLAFDQEEQGLVGSRAYAKTLKPADMLGVVHMEMMAYNSRKDGKFHVIDCKRADSTGFTAAIMGQVTALGLPLKRVDACTDASDHSAFWQKNIPAVCLSENFFGGDGDSCYHSRCDIVDGRLDFKYASMIATAVGNAVMGMVTGR